MSWAGSRKRKRGIQKEKFSEAYNTRHCKHISNMSHCKQTRLALIFDMDGVLVDSHGLHFKSWQTLAKEHGAIMTEEEFASLFGRTSRDIICKKWGQDLPDQQIAAMEKRKEALYRELLGQHFPAMDGAVQLIDAAIEGGFVLAVGSSGPPENVEMVLHRLGRAQSFDARVTGKDVTRGKPDPQVFLLAAQRLGADPLDCAVIEDAPAGIAAALAGGMTAIALTGTAPAEKLDQAHLIVSSLYELTPKRIADVIQANRNTKDA